MSVQGFTMRFTLTTVDEYLMIAHRVHEPQVRGVHGRYTGFTPEGSRFPPSLHRRGERTRAREASNKE